MQYINKKKQNIPVWGHFVCPHWCEGGGFSYCQRSVESKRIELFL